MRSRPKDESHPVSSCTCPYAAIDHMGASPREALVPQRPVPLFRCSGLMLLPLSGILSRPWSPLSSRPAGRRRPAAAWVLPGCFRGRRRWLAGGACRWISRDPARPTGLRQRSGQGGGQNCEAERKFFGHEFLLPPDRRPLPDKRWQLPAFQYRPASSSGVVEPLTAEKVEPVGPVPRGSIPSARKHMLDLGSDRGFYAAAV
jgi:hypothetical protein